MRTVERMPRQRNYCRLPASGHSSISPKTNAVGPHIPRGHPTSARRVNSFRVSADLSNQVRFQGWCVVKVRALQHFLCVLLILSVQNAVIGAQSSRQILARRVPAAVANGRAKPLGQLPATQRMNISIVLPLRNHTELANLLKSLYDPSSPDYHRFLSVTEFTGRFAPTTDDYQAVVEFARAQGFTLKELPANRLVVPVTATVEQIQNALNVQMRHYQHPTESRVFFSPDRAPSIPAGLNIADVVGLDSYTIPKPQVVKSSLDQNAKSTSVIGSGPGGSYLSSDMRAAYYGGSDLTGAGQTVALVQYDGYDINDVVSIFAGAATATNNGTDNVITYTPAVDGPSYSIPIHNVLLDGATGATGQFFSPADDAEQSIDVAQVIGMAPGLSQVRVYIGRNDVDILSAIASEDLAQQVSISWTWTTDATTDDPFFEEMAAQGQSVFAASGDYGTYVPWNTSYPAESNYITAVGGTSLVTSAAGGAWASETAWDRTGGGVNLDDILIPDWQTLAINGTNGGSATLRNVPDVAMEADFDNYGCSMGVCLPTYAGTSFAAPRWAGFIALVNQQAAAAGSPSVGFINPALYSLGEGANYNSEFHDTVNGSNNYYGLAPLPYYNAVAGYDLLTGWGSPAGQALIDALAPPASAGFNLSSSASTLTIKPGDQGTSTMSVVAQNGFTGSVNLAVLGLPNGVTPFFSINPVTEISVLTLSVASSAVRGSYAVTVTGTSGASQSSVSLTLNVDAPGFSILFPSSTFMVPQGATATTKASIIRYGGFTGAVNLTITSPLPPGLNAAWSQNPTTESSELSVSTTSDTYASTLTITGTSGNLIASAPLALDVVMPLPQIEIAPLPSVVAQGASATGTINIIPNGSLNGLTYLSGASSTGLTLTFNPTSILPGQPSTLTVTADASAPLGRKNACIGAGVAGGFTSACFFVTVTSPSTPAFTLSLSQVAPTLAQGSTLADVISINPFSGFTGSVNLSVIGLPSGVIAAISPNPSTGTSVLTLKASGSAAPGLYAVEVLGNSSGQLAQALINLTVSAAPSFYISLSSPSLSVVPGASANDTISVGPQSGFSGNVNLSVVSGLPTGALITFTPNPTGSTSTLALSTNASTPSGNYIVTIAGTSGLETANATLFLIVGPTGNSGTTTSLSVSPGAGTSSPIGTLYTLTATVTSALGPVTHGQVNFCDISFSFCADTHLLGTAQLDDAGTAVLRFHPPAGNHSYAAVFAGTPGGTPPYPYSQSAPVTLAVFAGTGTALSASGTAGNYTLSATATGQASFAPPSGTVSFVDTSNSNNVVGSAALGSGSSSLSFPNLSASSTGNSPSSVAVGDFNKDGNLDIAVTNQQDNTVGIFLGNGDGTFAAQSTVAVGNNPSSIVVGDFNNDGILDLAVVNQLDNTVSIILGTGNGAFTPALTTVGIGDQGSYSAPISIVAADFNGDGNLDLAILNPIDSTISVLLGNGDGTFTTANSPKTGEIPVAIAVGDFNMDGIPDLVVVNELSSSLTILLGSGDGTFTAIPINPATGRYPTSVAVGDFNGDGIPDMVVGNSSDHTLTILLGCGNGTFTPVPISPYPGGWPASITVGDYNGDGNLDLAIANMSSSVKLLLGNGDGTFSVAQSYPTFGAQVALTGKGDFNGDGVPDLVAVHYSNSFDVVASQIISTASASANSVTIVGTGTHSVAATYNGSSSYGSSISSAVPLEGILPTATPTFSITPGTYTSVQTVSISDTTPGAIIYYTINGTTPTSSSNPYSGAITVSSTETLQAVATASGYSTSAVASAAYTINLPTLTAPTISSISPAFIDAGTPAFSLTVTGSGFTSTSEVYWGTSVLTTQYLSATQLTAQVPAASIAFSGVSIVSVQNPDAGGSTSNILQFEVDSAPASTSSPTFATTTATVSAGSTATYRVTLPASATDVSATCLNLPSGATCSYSPTTGAVSIITKSSTPEGIYQTTVVFTETIPGASAAWVLFPVFLLPLASVRKRATYRKIWFAACLLLGLALAGIASGCGGSPGAGISPTPTPTQRVTSSGLVSITVK